MLKMSYSMCKIGFFEQCPDIFTLPPGRMKFQDITPQELAVGGKRVMSSSKIYSTLSQLVSQRSTLKLSQHIFRSLGKSIILFQSSMMLLSWINVSGHPLFSMKCYLEQPSFSQPRCYRCAVSCQSMCILAWPCFQI